MGGNYLVISREQWNALQPEARQQSVETAPEVAGGGVDQTGDGNPSEDTRSVVGTQAGSQPGAQAEGSSQEGASQALDIHAVYGALQLQQIQLSKLQSELSQRRDVSMDTIQYNQVLKVQKEAAKTLIESKEMS